MSGRRARRALVSVLVAADIVLVLLAGSRFFARVDMSRNGIYTLSRTSRDIVAGLSDQLSIEYWVSGLLASRYPFPSQIEDLLGEYATWSRGKVTLRVVDPARSRTPPETFGLSARQMQMVDRDQVNLAAVYSGIVLRYLDRTAAIPFVSDITTLEYDVSSRIRELETNRHRTIGILVGDARRSLSRDYRALMNELSAQFEVREVPRGAAVPPDVSVLFVLGNRDLDDAAVLPVDQYIMRGGRALFAVDAVDINLSGQISAQLTRHRAVQELLAQYGVRVVDGIVLDTVNQRITFTQPPGRVVLVNYPPWVTVSSSAVDAANPITARFSGLDLYWPCALEPIERDGVSVDVLARSSPRSWLMKDSFDINPAIAESMAPRAGEERGPRDLAIALSGSFRSAYAGLAAAAPDAGTSAGTAGGKAPLLARTVRDTRIIVVGNAEFASDLIQFTQASYNMTFLSNCAEWLSEDDDLLAVKTRPQGSTRLDAIPDPEDRARAMRSSVVVNLVVVPLAVALGGMVRLLRRKRRRSRNAGGGSA